MVSFRLSAFERDPLPISQDPTRFTRKKSSPTQGRTRTPGKRPRCSLPPSEPQLGRRCRVREPRSRLPRRQRFHTSRRRAYGPQQPEPNVLRRSHKIGIRRPMREELSNTRKTSTVFSPTANSALFGNVHRPHAVVLRSRVFTPNRALQRRHPRGPSSIRPLFSGPTERRLQDRRRRRLRSNRGYQQQPAGGTLPGVPFPRAQARPSRQCAAQPHAPASG